MPIVIKRRTLKILKQLFIVVAVIGISVFAVRALDERAGQELAEKGGDGCPQDMVFVGNSRGGFCVDKFEASPGPDCPYKEPGSSQDTRTNLDDAECKPVSENGARPWRFISRDQAREACAKAGKRLPTSEEWYQAVLGTPDKENGWTAQDCQVNKNWNQQPGRTGSAENCRSGAGAFDMIGNVWEWVKDDAEDGILEGDQLPGPGFVQAVTDKGIPYETDASQPNPDYNNDYLWLKNTGRRGVARGGYWGNASDAGKYAMYIVPPPDFSGPGIGFRCVK